MPVVPELLRTGETHSPVMNPARPSPQNLLMAAAIHEQQARMKLAEQRRQGQLGTKKR